LNTRAATTPNAEIVARGEAELGIQLISEIVSVPGSELLGPLPAELQAMNVISTGIVTTTSEPDAARVLLRFLTSPAAAAIMKAAGMEPGGS
jgi:molybdate transport system substrate-binding protein